MTRMNHGLDARTREPIARPTGRAAAGVVVGALALLTLTFLATPLGAADRGIVAPEAARAVDQAEAGQSEARAGEAVAFADRFVPDPEATYRNGQWAWRVPPKQWIAGALIGLILAGGLLLGVLATVRRPTLIEPAGPRGWFDPSAARSLPKLLVLAYLVAAAAFAGAAYSGSFGWLSGDVSEGLTGFARWAPMAAGPALGLLGILFGGGAKRWKVRAGDADALMKMMQDRSNAFLELVRVHVDDGFRREISRLAPQREVGLIQRTMWMASEKAVDQGRLQPAQRDEFMSRLLEIRPGEDDRSTFLNRRAAVELATELVGIDGLAQALEEGEWRKMGERRASEAGPEGPERRSGGDRRARSVWRPEGGLELDLAV